MSSCELTFSSTCDSESVSVHCTTDTDIFIYTGSTFWSVTILENNLFLLKSFLSSR